MKFAIGVILFTSCVLWLDITPALAHDSGHNNYYPRNSYQAVYIRGHKFPSQLKRERHFRKWYTQSSLKTNRYLTWQQLHNIYRWENSYSNYRYDRQHYHYGGRSHRNYNWYRKYWRNKQHRLAGYRRHSGRRH